MLETITTDIRKHDSMTTVNDLAETTLGLIDKYFADVADLHSPFEIAQARAIVGLRLSCVRRGR